MKLRNKKTGQEGNFIINKDHFECVDLDLVPEYNSLAELNEEWEDYEEPKWLSDYWFIDSCGGINKQETDILGANRREIGNYFETKEEAEKAVEKLRAWKRLKDKGFRFEEYSLEPEKYIIEFVFTGEEAWLTEVKPDLDLLFGH